RWDTGDTSCNADSKLESPFDDLTFAFHNKLESYGSKPKVVLVTSINPKVVGGKLLIICNVSSVKTQLHLPIYH
ncbi:unnamed protein product, partial [Brassica oleracea]